MSKRQKVDPFVLGDDEACVLTPADTKHWMLLNDAETEAMAEGRVCSSVQERARALLAYRQHAKEGDVFVTLAPPERKSA